MASAVVPAASAGQGLKDLVKLIDFLDLLLDTYDSVMADGKVDLFDARFLPGLLMASRGLGGISDIPAELKASSTEDQALAFQKALALVQKTFAHLSKKLLPTA